MEVAGTMTNTTTFSVWVKNVALEAPTQLILTSDKATSEAQRREVVSKVIKAGWVEEEIISIRGV